MKLLLFDIDGTLLISHGAGRRSVRAALSELVGRTVTTDGVTFSGKTDPQIMRELLVMNGVPEDERDELVARGLAIYAEYGAAMLDPSLVETLPGVEALLERLVARPDVQLGLLTGNLEPMAQAKLNAAGLAHYFPFGAYGSDHADRSCLPALAVNRAERHTGRRFHGTDVIIVGDTEHDVRCGEALGVFTVAVCTGRYDAAALAAHHPDLLLDDLSDVEGFIERVLVPAAA